MPSAATRGIDFAKQPLLEGYVVTLAKPRASVLLGGPEDDPILATWSVGIGRAAAFTSDYKDRWGQQWLAWPEGAKLFGQLGRDVARKTDDPRVRLEADATAGELRVRADVVGDDGRAQTFRRLTAHVAGPEGFSRDVQLEAVGAGRYAASCSAASTACPSSTGIYRSSSSTSGRVAATTSTACRPSPASPATSTSGTWLSR